MELMRFIFSASLKVFILAVLAGVGSGLSMVGLLALTNQMLHAPEHISLITGSVFAVLTIAMVFFRVNSTVLLAKLSQNSIAQLRMRLCRKILQAPLADLEKQGGHKLLASLTDDVTSIANGIMRLPFLFINIAVVIGCLAYMLWLSWWLFLLALAFIFVGVTAYRLPETRALKRLTQARTYSDKLYQGFKAVCEGTKELKMHQQRRDGFLSGPLAEATEGYSENTVGATRYYSFAGSLGLFFFFTIIGVLIFIVPQWATLSSTTLVGYVMAFLFIQGPMEIVVNAIPDLAKTTVGLKKIQKLGLNLHEEQASEVDSIHANHLNAQPWRTITLSNLVHSYYREQEDNHFQLGPINLTLNAGELIFLIGGNGSGKTTFAKLLLGLYTPESGQILVDDQPINDGNREEYRQLFSAIFVDFYLFEQLLGFDNKQVDAKAQSYIDRLQLGHKVTVENGKLSTVQLSQGQKKRLALLTAYLEDRDFYMFDEWAADQDPVFKQFFYRQILPDLRAKGKTVLVISHDDQYFDVADRYIKMNSGKAIISQEAPETLAILEVS